MAFVPHHAAHDEAGGPRAVGQVAGVLRPATAAGEPDVHVDQHFGDTGTCRGRDGLLGVHCDGHPRPLPGERAEPGRVGHLVGEEKVLSEAGVGHALHLGDGGAGETRVSVRRLALRQRGALVGLDVRPQPPARERLRHGAQIGLEPRRVDEEGRRRQLRRLHRPEVTERCGAAAGARVLSAS